MIITKKYFALPIEHGSLSVSFGTNRSYAGFVGSRRFRKRFDCQTWTPYEQCSKIDASYFSLPELLCTSTCLAFCLSHVLLREYLHLSWLSVNPCLDWRSFWWITFELSILLEDLYMKIESYKYNKQNVLRTTIWSCLILWKCVLLSRV